MRFRDRSDAGRVLAEGLVQLRGEDPIVLGLPRGGVPVAAEVAAALGAPLDIVLVRKIGAPDRAELAVGAVGEDGVTVRNDAVLTDLGLSWADLSRQVGRERAEIERRATALRPGGPRPSLRERTVVLVDDGIATGATVVAAIRVLRRLGARRIVLAVPVAPADSVPRLREIADDVVCALAPERFIAVGQWYDDFTQVPDKQVRALLATATADSPPAIDETVTVGGLTGHLFVPVRASGVVVFARSCNQVVPSMLHRVGIGTVLVDHGEAESDVDQLAGRLRSTAGALRDDHRLAGLPVGFFGASTGTAAALRAAADVKVSAIVSWGGRPDLAAESLGVVEAPTMLIVGGRDEEMLRLNSRARRRMRCRTDLAVVPGAGHLFEEPGALDTVARLATDWFEQHFGARPR